MAVTNVNTGRTYKAEELLGTLVNKGLKLFSLLYLNKFKQIGHAWFDVKMLNDGKNTKVALMKNLPGITPTLTTDGEAVLWNDYGMFDFSTEIKTASSTPLVAFETTLEVNSTSGFSVNDTLYVIGAGTATDMSVDAVVKQIVDATHVKIEVKVVNGVAATATNAIAIKVGSKVRRGGWLRNDQDVIDRPIYMSKYLEFKSYVQHFSRRISFTKQEINQEYKYFTDVKQFVQNRIATQMAILAHELNVALYKGTNEAPTAQAKKQMLGLEKVCVEGNGVKDLTGSTDMIKDLFEEFQKAQASSAVSGSSRLQVLCNSKFLTEISYTQRDKIRFMDNVSKLDFSIPVLSTPYGEVELLTDPVLDEFYPYSVAFTLPRELVTCWFRENTHVDENGNLVKDDKSIRVYKVIDNNREKDSYDFTFECGAIYGGMGAEVSPYRMIKNFKAS